MSDDPRLKLVVDHAVPPVALRMTRADTEQWGQEEPPRKYLNLGMCSGVGKLGVVKDGVLVCPSCGDPVAEGCGSSRYRTGDDV